MRQRNMTKPSRIPETLAAFRGFRKAGLTAKVLEASIGKPAKERHMDQIKKARIPPIVPGKGGQRTLDVGGFPSPDLDGQGSDWLDSVSWEDARLFVRGYCTCHVPNKSKATVAQVFNSYSA